MQTFSPSAQTSVVLYPIPLDQLADLISSAVKKQFDSFQSVLEEDEYITRRETAALLGVSLVTLGEWSKTGKVTGYRIGSRIRFKRAEVVAALKQIKSDKSYK